VYHPATRVLAVLELLQARGRLSGPELATRLEVDRRTVRRYVTMLQDLGIPVEAERGRHGGYRLRPGYKLPPLLFTEDEALALTLGLLAVHRLGLVSLDGAGAAGPGGGESDQLAGAAGPGGGESDQPGGGGRARAVEGALAKLDRVLPAARRERLRAVQDVLALSLPVPAQPEPAPAGATVLTLSTAARHGRRVGLRYRSWRGEESERDLDPYGLVYRAGRWYVVGWCHLRGGVRVFRLDRVLAADLRPQTFTPPAGFDSVEYVMRSLANVPSDWTAEVLLEVPIEVARQRVPPVVATLEETEEGVVLRAGTDSLDWLARYLVTIDLPLVVRRPPELRDALRRLADRVADLAARRTA
jgi:predicted DNA-binding transcriptional regulator YafY